MKIFYYSNTLSKYLKTLNGSIGFVPTMGALHDGHLQLVRDCGSLCDFTVVSVFVNPRQFNQAEDLAKYPRTLAADLEKLFYSGADFVFFPSEKEVYQQFQIPEIALGNLDNRFEGEKRPGHFKGVTQVLYALFSIISPQHVFFGQKDLQQCMVVKQLIKQQFPQIAQHNMKTMRESSGLAMSSRNTRLSSRAKSVAPGIYKELKMLSELQKPALKFNEVISTLKSAGIETEYLDMIELPEFNPVTERNPAARQALIYAGWIENIRLIDNIVLD